MQPPTSSTRASTLTTNTVGTSTTAATFTSVSSFLPPRAEQRIHIWLSEVPSSPLPTTASSSSSSSPYHPSHSSTHLAHTGNSSHQQHHGPEHSAHAFFEAPPTLNHGVISIAQLYSTREKGPSLKERLRKLARFGRKEKVWGFEGEHVRGDLHGRGEPTAMYDLDVCEVAPRASFQIEEKAAASAARGVDGGGSLRRRMMIVDDADVDLDPVHIDDGIVRLDGSDFGAGVVGQRRLMDAEFRRLRGYSAV